MIKHIRNEVTRPMGRLAFVLFMLGYVGLSTIVLRWMKEADNGFLVIALIGMIVALEAIRVDLILRRGADLGWRWPLGIAVYVVGCISSLLRGAGFDIFNLSLQSVIETGDTLVIVLYLVTLATSIFSMGSVLVVLAFWPGKLWSEERPRGFKEWLEWRPSRSTYRSRGWE